MADTLRQLIDSAQSVVFFGGAGVSTESGIPDFRSAHGLYTQDQSYEDMLSSRYFFSFPDRFWAFYKAVMLYPDAKPNQGHLALAKLERLGKLKAVVTQNIDGLHQAAGSKTVYELHGTVHRNTCLDCGKRFSLADVLAKDGTPRCDCGGLIKPDVVLYGESLDDAVTEAAVGAIAKCDLLIVGGTSLTVYPAAGLISYQRAGKLALINREETPYDRRADWISRESIGKVLGQAVSD